MALTTPAPADIRHVLLETYTVNERINQVIFEHLDRRAWRAKSPRTIAAIFAHVHNIRRKWLRLSAPHLKLPAPLDRTLRSEPGKHCAQAKRLAVFCDACGNIGPPAGSGYGIPT